MESNEIQAKALTREVVRENKLEWLTVREFIAQFDLEVSWQAINGRIKAGVLDYMYIEGNYFIVLTPKTLSYRPRAYKRSQV